MLAPMQVELDPIVQKLALTASDDGSVHRGRAGRHEVVAVVTNIGMAAGAAAARALLDLGVDHLMVVGIAGGIDPDRLAIGHVIEPERVIDRAAGREHVAVPIGGRALAGTISCGDDLIIDPAALATMAAAGIDALDMETAAIAAACEAAGCAWSAYRAISDFAGGGLVSDAIFALTNADGSADPEALARYLAEDPAHLEVLGQLARDTGIATAAAADAAITACHVL